MLARYGYYHWNRTEILVGVAVDIFQNGTSTFFSFFEIVVYLGKMLVYKLMIWTCIWCPGPVFGVLGRV